jgi:hypothetical protein
LETGLQHPTEHVGVHEARVGENFGNRRELRKSGSSRQTGSGSSWDLFFASCRKQQVIPRWPIDVYDDEKPTGIDTTLRDVASERDGLRRSSRALRRQADESREIMHNDDEVGWVSRSLDDSMQQAEAAGLAILQLVIVSVALVSAVSVPMGVLVAAHLAVFAIGCLIVWRRLRAWPLLLAVYAVTVLDYRATVDLNSALSFSALWVSILTAAVPALVIDRRRHAWVFSLLAMVTATGSLLLWHPTWGPRLTAATIITATALMIAALTLMRPMRRFAREADSQQIVLARERERRRVRHAVVQASAEDARVVHDTLINTLGAIANGGGAMSDTTLVRERCARDVEALEALLDGRRADRPAFLLTPANAGWEVEIRRTGLDGEELGRLADRMHLNAFEAMGAAVQELIRNASKHSGADHVTLDVRRNGPALIVTVSDEGRGFDGRLIAGRGLAESVVARARDVGADVAIRTKHGAGTAVTLTIPLDPDQTTAAKPFDELSDVGPVVERIRRTACWTWAAVMVGFSAVDVVINQPVSASMANAMVVLVGGLSLTAWGLGRHRAELPRWLTILLLVAVPPTFLAGLGAVDFGRSGANGWPTVLLTPLLIVLLVMGRSRTPFFVGIALLASAAGATAVVVWSSAPSAAVVVLAGAAIQLAILAAWLIFYRTIDGIGRRLNRIQGEIVEGRAERAAEDMITAARTRWTTAGAQASLEILKLLARGEIDPDDPQIRVQCADAELYLRQILLLNPEIVHLSPWIGRALSDARSKSVSLILRGCTEDAPDAEAAEPLGQLMLAGIEALPTGAQLSVGFFRVDECSRLLMVGPRGSLGTIVAPASPLGTSTFTYHRLGARDLIEFVVIRRDSMPPLGASPYTPQPSGWGVFPSTEDHSAVSDRIGSATETLYQELIDAEEPRSSAQPPTSGLRRARPCATAPRRERSRRLRVI